MKYLLGHKKKLALLALAASVILLLPACGQKAETPSSGSAPLKITLLGGSPGGMWAALSEAIGQAVRTEYPDATFTVEPGNESGNIVGVSNGEAELGLILSPAAKMAEQGLPPFEKPVTGFYLLATLYKNNPMHFIVRKDFADQYGVKTFDDIKQKKVPVKISVNQKGMSYEYVIADVLKAYGFSYEDIKSWGGQVVYQAASPSLDLMKDRRLDIACTTAYAPWSAVQEASVTMPLSLFPVKKEAVEVACQKWASVPITIKKGVYPWLESDVPSYSPLGQVIIGKSVPEDVAYKLAKALYNHVDMLQGVAASMKETTPSVFVETGGLAIHPGAEKFYREVGLIK